MYTVRVGVSRGMQRLQDLKFHIGTLVVREYLPGATAAGHVFCASVVLTL